MEAGRGRFVTKSGNSKSNPIVFVTRASACSQGHAFAMQYTIRFEAGERQGRRKRSRKHPPGVGFVTNMSSR